jgi:GNAT superfamily N-acetyltransferase
LLRRFKAITEAGYPYFVAELDGGVLGYAYANAYRPRRAYRFTVEDSVYVAPEAQGKGVGQLLLGELIDACTRQGFRLMIAVIGDSAQHRSIALHRRLGFTFCGTIHSVGYKHRAVMIDVSRGVFKAALWREGPSQSRGRTRARPRPDRGQPGTPSPAHAGASLEPPEHGGGIRIEAPGQAGRGKFQLDLALQRLRHHAFDDEVAEPLMLRG